MVERLRAVSDLSRIVKRGLHTSYPVLKLKPSRYWLWRFLFLRNLLRIALRSETRSSLGNGAEKHRESRALYRAIAVENVSVWTSVS
jgi:hypothetical protein